MFSHDSIGVAEADRKLVGSALVVHVESLEAARAIVEEDAYWVNNVVCHKLTPIPSAPLIEPVVGPGEAHNHAFPDSCRWSPGF